MASPFPRAREADHKVEARWRYNLLNQGGGVGLRALRPNDHLDLAVEHLEKREHLVDGLAVVGGVGQTVELCRRRPQAADDLAL